VRIAIAVKLIEFAHPNTKSKVCVEVVYNSALCWTKGFDPIQWMEVYYDMWIKLQLITLSAVENNAMCIPTYINLRPRTSVTENV